MIDLGAKFQISNLKQQTLALSVVEVTNNKPQTTNSKQQIPNNKNQKTITTREQ